MPQHKKVFDDYEGHHLPPLIRGTLVKRYKRFLADVELPDGTVVTAHCPNSGSMKACCEAGRPAYLSTSDNPKRKLKYTWELLEMPESLVGINTQIPNKLVKRSIESGLVPELSGYAFTKSEIKTSEHTRLDILLSNENGLTKDQPSNEKATTSGGTGSENAPPLNCYIEVKNCTLVENRMARFPDAVTTRGQKHLMELDRLKREGHRAVLFILIQRMDVDAFIPAADIDPEYARLFYDVHQNGVEVIIRRADVTPEKISLGPTIPLLSRPECHKILSLEVKK